MIGGRNGNERVFARARLLGGAIVAAALFVGASAEAQQSGFGGSFDDSQMPANEQGGAASSPGGGSGGGSGGGPPPGGSGGDFGSDGFGGGSFVTDGAEGGGSEAASDTGGGAGTGGAGSEGFGGGSFGTGGGDTSGADTGGGGSGTAPDTTAETGAGGATSEGFGGGSFDTGGGGTGGGGTGGGEIGGGGTGGGGTGGGGTGGTGGPITQLVAFELQDFGVQPTQSLYQGAAHGPTPTRIPGGQVITTEQLVALKQQQQIVLIDVLGSNMTVPNALPAAGLGAPGSFNDQVQAVMVQGLQQVTGGNNQVPVVFFCQGPQCWLSYNAALRAIAAGYTNVFWYRGGIEAWAMIADVLGELLQSLSKCCSASRTNL